MSESTTGPTRQTESNSLTQCERHGLLSSDRRRVAIEVLGESAAPLTLDELATAVARHETTDPPDATATEDVATLLHHVHLPQMDELNVVDYDFEHDRVEACRCEGLSATASN